MMVKTVWGRIFNAVFWALIMGLIIYGILSYISMSLRSMYHMFGLVANQVFWLIIITLVVFIVFRMMVRRIKMKKDDPPIQILRERFARGEISDEEFKQKTKLVRRKY
ncbi:SHOCT domain-containing protein [Paenibacillus chondroitinus]|uniref:SHOCT domain-containing protein n=1 Tax=Paenibacillus chondroitinus TaxID=59842 RepID=A0ABU6DGK2_9BACL|nr:MULTISPECIES: SHOCT domain-containing protein [Paenibacillus]MCY9659494.1 SHOCT domain-containing protein [Paenibacillus anseongense]MEB4796889.1 SHOCT domain-containing protein [Paenibacillus chondroitinus]